MKSIVRTIYGAKLQTAQLLQVPVVIPPHSTLNEKFNIAAAHSIPDSVNPSLKYAAIGNGGHRMIVGADGISYPEPIKHLPRHAALYNQLPFILRSLDNDLPSSQRSKYRLRTIIQIGGVSYVAYYLKVLDLSNTVPETQLYSVTDGITSVSSFLPNSGDLNPEPPDLSSTGVIATTGDYIAATAKVPFSLTADDLDEFINVCNLIYQNPKFAIISEIALCSGIDKNITGDFFGTQASYTEAIGVQVNSFISSFYPAEFINRSIDLTFDVGAVEALNITA